MAEPAGGGDGVRAALADAARRIAGETPRLDAELLMAAALGVDREALLLRHLDAPVPPAFAGLLARRLGDEPVAYITGRRGFWTIEIEVGPGVLVPRPDSETLIEAAVAHFGEGRVPRTILDLGTGPGTLLLAALDQWPEARGIGIDRSPTALGFARRNADRLGLSARAQFRDGDWADAVSSSFDLVLCNPPYVAADAALPAQVRLYEPAEALFAGDDGLGDYRRIAPQLPPLIATGGIACLEIGAGQAQAVTALLEREGLAVFPHRDLGGHVRCLACLAD